MYTDLNGSSYSSFTLIPTLLYAYWNELPHNGTHGNFNQFINQFILLLLRLANTYVTLHANSRVLYYHNNVKRMAVSAATPQR